MSGTPAAGTFVTTAAAFVGKALAGVLPHARASVRGAVGKKERAKPEAIASMRIADVAVAPLAVSPERGVVERDDRIRPNVLPTGGTRKEAGTTEIDCSRHPDRKTARR
jgi:hypothetical protein